MSLGKRHSIALGAAGSVKWPGGRFFKLIQAAADVTVEFFTADGEPMGEFINVRSGLKFSIEPSDIGKAARLTGFGSVKITSATAQTVAVIIARQAIDYDSVSATVALEKSTTLTSFGVSFAAVTGGVLAAADAGQREIIISFDLENNPTHPGPLRVGGSTVPTDGIGIPLYPGESVTLETAGAVYAYNSNATIAAVVYFTRVKD